MRWTDLPAELLCRVGDYLDDLKCYASARGACTAWRRALAPPSPSLLVVLDGDATGCCCPAARRSFGLRAIPSGGLCIGSSNGWLALSVRLYGRLSIFSLFHPVTADEIRLPPLIYKSSLVSKLVFAPSPARDDFAAAAICDIDRLAYVTAGARRWAILDPVRLAAGDQLADVVYRGQANGAAVVEASSAAKEREKDAEKLEKNRRFVYLMTSVYFDVSRRTEED